jgi:uncharacterized protein (DUF1697 family)
VTSSTTRYVALLRGINVGKAKQVDMPRLRTVLTARGHGEVLTHLRSGNVLLDSGLDEAALAADVSTAIADEFGLAVSVVVRTARQLAAVVAADPLGELRTDPARYSVTFLPERPAAALVADLPPADGGEYRIQGRELYLWLPDGMSKSPMGTWKWDTLLGVAGTNRNWNTVTRLAELAG